MAEPTPDPAVMRDYIDRLTRFYMDNPAWVALAEEARGYIGTLEPKKTDVTPEFRAQVESTMNGLIELMKDLPAYISSDQRQFFEESIAYKRDVLSKIDAGELKATSHG